MPKTTTLVAPETDSSRAAARKPLAPDETKRRDAFVGRLFGAALQAIELQSLYLGRRLGYYESLARYGPLTSKGLAGRTKSTERYAREWLEQQAVAGILDVANPSSDASERRYSLSAAHQEVLLDQESLYYLGFFARLPIATAQQMEPLIQAYRKGGGVAWSDYGPDFWEAQAEQNRPFLFQQFAKRFLPEITDVDARLRADPPARVADIACGAGWASIAIAQAYPNVRIDGFDLDTEAIEMAKASSKTYDVADRVRFHARDAADPGVKHRFDLVVIVEAVHDFSQPVKVLAAARKLLAPGGSVLVVDENVAETFTAPGSELERLFYGFSILACLPNGMADRPSAETGTVMRPATLQRYAKEAGLARFEVLPLQHDFFRFYRLKV